MHNQLLNSLKAIVPLSHEEQDEFLKIIEIRSIKKKNFALKELEFCDRIFYVHSGALRIFYHINELEKTSSFCFENCWFTDFQSYLTGKRTLVNLQALEETTIITFKKSDIEKLYLKYHSIERIGRILVEQAFVKFIEESLMVNSESPESRYIKLIEQRPELFQRIPQQHIASFLNIQPESLSRIRKRISFK